MSLTQASTFECPYCMTINDLEVDEINDIGQTQVTDCQICCQPIVVTIRESDGEIDIQAEQENE
ncbi:CPXCG motif-containing cysteine-rich protein [Alteromonas gilva]|uniref:CPXCG motif-containing cysteine-rich protein n=1 Tax=Alteromonas gilva TaxID=2987522 RepID=A0ABT5KYZ3_9ALTE|nr:CPXCG motif-containing cysteine-rich protein [Alteromonas gilva]MDC8829404.1 CPXCG motif-containing cysteine-rich protein [Alteromonas gilva]